MCIVYSISMPKTFWFSGDRVHCQVVRLGGQWVDPETVGVRIYFGQDGCIGRDISSEGWFGSFRFLSSFLNYPYHMGIVVTKTWRSWIRWDFDSWKNPWLCQAAHFDASVSSPSTPEIGRAHESSKKIWPEIEDESLVVIPTFQEERHSRKSRTKFKDSKRQGRTACKRRTVPTLH